MTKTSVALGEEVMEATPVTTSREGGYKTVDE